MSYDSGLVATSEETYLRASQVAELMQVGPKTIARWAKEGKLPYLRTLGGHRRYPKSKIEALVAELQQEVTVQQ